MNRKTGPALLRRASHCVIAAALAAGLAGCNDSTGALEASAPGGAPRIAARPGVSPSGATVAFVTVEGAPPAIVARFSERTTAEATRREVSIAQMPAADYLVRGYLSAQTIDGGASFAYVWDVFDKQRRRVRRTEDTINVKGSGSDPWGLASEQVLTSLAARSADDLAAILSNMPEAVAAGRAPAATSAIAAAAPGAAPPSLPAGTRAYR